MIIIGLAAIVFLVFCYILIKFLSLKVSIIIIVSIIFILLIFYFINSSNFFVESTDLKNESLNEIHLGDEITPLLFKELKNSYGKIVNDTGMAILITTEHDNSYKFEKVYLGVTNNKVNSVVSENPNIKTSKGISIGDNIVAIKELYGNNFKSSIDEIGETITYIDKDRNILLRFVINKEEVYQIILTTNS
ncbi:hypothetical protein ABIE66_004779 [Peribacillus sp. B2I2]|uniref:hypothetical protein n=1 Tax=Peribacillus sp. B2I2 TaxID=3156468 RepID=UPI003517708D